MPTLFQSLRELSLPFGSFIVCILFCGLPVQAQEETVQSDLAAAVEPESEESNLSDISELLFNGKEPTSVEQLRAMETHFAELAEKVYAATVNIQMGGAQGTGVVVSDDGYILTAAHVINVSNLKEARITFLDENGETRSLIAEKRGVERGIDSGMLKIKNEDSESFPYLDVGLSSDLKLGQWVMAVGHPGGLDSKRGMVVRVGRVIFRSSRVIRTDCTLVGGDSGGPLVDMNGDLIGIHSRIGQRLLDNIHVPVDTYSENWDDLAAGIVLDGDPSLGFSVDGDSNIIDAVNEQGPAEKAGIKSGDKLVKIGDVTIKNKTSIRDAIKSLNLRPNQKVNIL
ncbi:MAG: S1C family serine protease, partial [Planctomycetota bacterium]